MKIITLSDLKTVISRPKQMYAWPGIVRAANGDILVAASERRFHCCPYGREVIVRSKDAGQSWSLPQEIYNSELDDRDANLCMTQDGTIILSWFTSIAFERKWGNLVGGWPERAEHVSEIMRKELLGGWMCCSRDIGNTWEKPKRMPVGLHISPNILSDDTLIAIGLDPVDQSVLRTYKSADMGESWYPAGALPCNQGQYENHIMEIAPGKLLAMFRSDSDNDGYLYQSFSTDSGDSWSIPYKTSIWGYPPQLLRLHNGVIMCSYSFRRKPYSIRAVFSHNKGLTWDTDNIQTIYQWEDEPDMGYPSSIELNPGKILTVFYCSRRDSNETEVLPEGILSVSSELENF